MVEFETIKAEEIKFGRNNFIEISRKKAITDGGENEFISIARGFYLPDGAKGWKYLFSKLKRQQPEESQNQQSQTPTAPKKEGWSI